MVKGKIAFLCGAALGYVLGARAGRARYEQIRRGAQAVWRTASVQRGVTLVRSKVGARADRCWALLRRVVADAFRSVQGVDTPPARSDEAGERDRPVADASAAAPQADT